MTVVIWRLVCVALVVIAMGVAWYGIHRWIEPHYSRASSLIRNIKLGLVLMVGLAGAVAVLAFLNVIHIPPIAVTLLIIAAPAVMTPLVQPLMPGLMVLMTHPWHVGGEFEANVGGCQVRGTVVKMKMDYTFVLREDGKLALVPNYLARQGVVIRPVTDLDRLPPSVTGQRPR